jgi:hypothetical protein
LGNTGNTLGRVRKIRAADTVKILAVAAFVEFFAEG